jgi:hypothetical protein
MTVGEETITKLHYPEETLSVHRPPNVPTVSKFQRPKTEHVLRRLAYLLVKTAFPALIFTFRRRS